MDTAAMYQDRSTQDPDAEPSLGTQAEMTISALVLQRNKRALLLYLHQRIDTIKEQFWLRGGSVSSAFGQDTDTRRHMAPVDEAFAKRYNELCLSYKSSFFEDADYPGMEGPQLLDVVDLLSGGTEAEPPRDLFVSVRVIKEVGDIETVSGAKLSLNKGSQYYLQRDDVENLVVQGYVELIE
ncbi:DNA replication protein psf1 [Microbotryomycetes sp. JL221]|nr:DNA replication protein psf1 [Microbotryomycetes sp. JL221]